ncbi:PREDICTED: RNA polymerase II-associated protein 3-like [Ceratosolen solmsi marchali]|uniref:RNA polymerase II-associated protein 3 n=1 Tax=Ceratosolen solmsi marchali TaxID=326594 RepID=A0AAJ7DZX7_9HYME|nr:PREDICTED: RNA polymerase II-associated protein 3-like [Ceratosolen solmsi marchali]
MDNAFMLQKQIKENSEDLQKEFCDMEAWEEQMRKKDLEIRNMKNNEKLPAIRKKKKKKIVPTPDVAKDKKPKKPKKCNGISDYDAWNKFDADEACKEIDDSNNLTEKKGERKFDFEVPDKAQLEEEHARAVTKKNEGNDLVKKQQYTKAIGKYNEAIQIFPYDATFFANRALCQLKINNLYSAEGDCTTAIQLDNYYVKAYHRRATVRIELKRYTEAEKDIEKILKLEPSNKEAAYMLTVVKKKISSSSKMMVISGESGNEKSSIEKVIGKKLVCKNLINTKLTENKIEKTHLSDTKDKSSEIKGNIIKQSNDNVENAKDQLNTKLKTSGNKYAPEVKKPNNVEKIFINTSNNEKLPSWLPKCREGLKFVQPLEKVTERVSKSQILRRISVSEVLPNESIFKDIEEINEEKNMQSDVENKTTLKINNLEESKSSENKCDQTVQNVKTVSTDQELPSWLPKCREGISIVDPLTNTLRRVKQTLKRISVSEVSSNESIFKDIEEINEEKSMQSDVENKTTLKRNNLEELKNNTVSVKDCSHNTNVTNDLPPPPRSFVEFMTIWRKNASSDFRHKFLLQITPNDLPDIFKDSLESNLFSEILSILNIEFVSNNDKVYDLLFYFGKVKRFRALVLFMTQADKKALQNLFNYCKWNEKKTKQEINSLRTMFEM